MHLIIKKLNTHRNQGFSKKNVQLHQNHPFSKAIFHNIKGMFGLTCLNLPTSITFVKLFGRTYENSS